MDTMSRLQFVLLANLLCFGSGVALGGERIDLSPDHEPGQLTHVSIQLEAGGHSLIRSQKQSGDKAPPAEQQQPISVAAKLAYDEKQLTPATAELPAGTPLSVRYYDEAEAVIKVNETGRAPKLA